MIIVIYDLDTWLLAALSPFFKSQTFVYAFKFYRNSLLLDLSNKKFM